MSNAAKVRAVLIWISGTLASLLFGVAAGSALEKAVGYFRGEVGMPLALSCALAFICFRLWITERRLLRNDA